MSAIKLNSSGGGSITISPASTASTLTLTAPAQTGTIGLDGPAFSAYANANQTIANSTWTKLQFQVEVFDTNNCFDNVTNYRFTPTAAGYYMFTAATRTNIGATGEIMVAIYKNGVEAMRGGNINLQTWALATYQPSVNSLLYMNGSTDYVEAYYLQTTGSSVTTVGASIITYFTGCMMRAA